MKTKRTSGRRRMKWREGETSTEGNAPQSSEVGPLIKGVLGNEFLEEDGGPRSAIDSLVTSY